MRGRPCAGPVLGGRVSPSPDLSVSIPCSDQVQWRTANCGGRVLTRPGGGREVSVGLFVATTYLSVVISSYSYLHTLHVHHVYSLVANACWGPSLCQKNCHYKTFSVGLTLLLPSPLTQTIYHLTAQYNHSVLFCCLCVS